MMGPVLLIELGEIMRILALVLLGASTFFVSGCGNFFSDPSEDFDQYGTPANVSPGGRFKMDWVERGFSARGLTRCQLSASQNGLGVLEVGFQDADSDSEMNLTLTGFNPQSNQHQIVGSGRTSGGSVVLKAGGDQRLNLFRNVSANGRGSSSQCQVKTRVQGTYIEAAFQCQNLYNDYGQPRNASGEVRCLTEQYTWDE